METKIRKTRVAKIKRRRKERGRRKETRREEVEEESGKEKEEENDGGKEDSKRIRDIGRRGESSKVRERSKKAGIKIFLQVNSHVWKEIERMPTRKLWDHAIEIKKGFVLRKGKIYPLFSKEREEMYEFISEKLRKEYIRILKLS